MAATPREKAIEWARRIAAEPNAVFLDTETTGLGPGAEICDIAIVGIDGRVLLDSLVLPLNPIPPDASAVHGITVAMIERAKAPMFREVHPQIVRATEGRVVVVYNEPYDRGVITALCRAEKLGEPLEQWEDALKAFSDFDGTMTSRRVQRGNRWVWERSPKWHKLSEACAAMGVHLDGAHRALADAQACRQLVLAMAGTAEPTTDAAPVQLALVRQG